MNNDLVKLAIALAAGWAVFKYGSPLMKGAALGAAGYIIANNIPVVQDVLQVRIIRPATATAAAG